jgi:hypothetical protein
MSRSLTSDIYNKRATPQRVALPVSSEQTLRQALLRDLHYPARTNRAATLTNREP